MLRIIATMKPKKRGVFNIMLLLVKIFHFAPIMKHYVNIRRDGAPRIKYYHWNFIWVACWWLGYALSAFMDIILKS